MNFTSSEKDFIEENEAYVPVPESEKRRIDSVETFDAELDLMCSTAAAGAMRGYDMVMSPHNLTYYSYPQGIENDPFLRKGNLSLEKSYGFDPLAGVPDEAKSHILGGQCCLWGEYIWNFYDLNWRMWPRAFAMSEILWTT